MVDCYEGVRKIYNLIAGVNGGVHLGIFNSIKKGRFGRYGFSNIINQLNKYPKSPFKIFLLSSSDRGGSCHKILLLLVVACCIKEQLTELEL